MTHQNPSHKLSVLVKLGLSCLPQHLSQGLGRHFEIICGVRIISCDLTAEILEIMEARGVVTAPSSVGRKREIALNGKF